MASKRKQDEKHLNLLRGMAKLDHNKQCIDCNQRGPTYLNMTIGAFVCTSCSGLLRGLNPPHRVKSISMASFTPEEIEFVRSRGNEFCRKVWLGLHSNRNCDFLDKDENKIKDFMVLKYEKKRYYVAPTEAMMEEARQHNTPPKTEPQTKPLRSLGNIPNISVQNHPGQIATGSARPVANHPTQNTASVPQLPTQQVSRPAAHHQPGQPANVTAATNKTTVGGGSLLEDLGGDPFAGTQQQQQGGFANFEAFGAQPSQPQMPHSISQPTGFVPTNAMGPNMLSPMASTPIATPTANAGGAVVQSNSFGAFSTPSSSSATSVSQPAVGGSASDRYSALAELDSVFGGTTTTQQNTVNWDGSAGGSSSGSVFGGGGGSNTGGNVFGGSANTTNMSNTASFNSAPNPFGTNTSQVNTSTGVAANPFSAPGSGFGQSATAFNQAGAGGFGQMSTATNSGSNNMGGFSQFGSTYTTASNVTGGQLAGMTNGNMAQPPQQQQMWGMTQQPAAQQGQINAFGGGGMIGGGGGMVGGASAAQTAGFGGKAGQQVFPGQAPVQQQFGGAAGAGGWGGAQPAANPFMNIANQQQANRPLNSTNPFL